MANEKRRIDTNATVMGMAECKDCIHKFVCETLKGKLDNSWAKNCIAYRHRKTCLYECDQCNADNPRASYYCPN